MLFNYSAATATENAIQMNDVSILFPLANSQADFLAYLKAEDQGLGGPAETPNRHAVRTVRVCKRARKIPLNG